MAEKLTQYIEKVRQDFSGSEEQLLLHRLYYLTGKQLLESAEKFDDNDSILALVEQSFSTINKNTATEDESSPAADETASVAELPQANETDVDSAQVETQAEEEIESDKNNFQANQSPEFSAVRLALSVKKIASRYHINGQSFVFASLPFHNQLLSALSSLYEEDEKSSAYESLKKSLSLTTATLAYEQLKKYFETSNDSFTSAQIIESGLFWFKKAGWGTFHFLVQQPPYLIALDHDFEKAMENQEHSFVCALLQGVCSYAHSYTSPQSFQVIKSTPEELQGQYGDLKNYSLLFYIKDVSHG